MKPQAFLQPLESRGARGGVRAVLPGGADGRVRHRPAGGMPGT